MILQYNHCRVDEHEKDRDAVKNNDTFYDRRGANGRAMAGLAGQTPRLGTGGVADLTFMPWAKKL